MFQYFLCYRHVHGFLEEIGQGVQHVASRVDDIISFVQEANDRRKVFGEVSTQHVIAIVVKIFLTCIYTDIFSITLTLCVLFSLGLHISKYSPKLLRRLNEVDVTQRY